MILPIALCTSLSAYAPPSMAASPMPIHAGIHLFLNEINGSLFKSSEVCVGSAELNLLDVRKTKVSNADPRSIFQNCSIAYNNQTLKAQAWIGVALYKEAGQQEVEDRRGTEVAIQVGDQVQTLWLTEYDLKSRDKSLTMNFPVPQEFRKAGSKQSLRVVVDFGLVPATVRVDRELALHLGCLSA